ncbi:leucine-rich repeat domain-containing protein [uncultured Psychroserpens sp.]|uniref:leucine-rich repeat domain-containing protein n=1 Tax=uncultured Psychroserpens sp. TaxID=255436 RepID=UPI00263887D4|nr:leucine-rich repeat domain-containing protein [uncultured Psychroserpens sp.]
MKFKFLILVILTIFSCTAAKNYELVELDLSNKGLKKLPKDILKYNKLKSINLRNNKLKEFPIELSKLSNLETLIISNNLIDTIPKEILNLKRLKYLYVDDNRIKYFNNMRPLSNLELVTITNNPLRTLDLLECYIPSSAKILHEYGLPAIKGSDCKN